MAPPRFTVVERCSKNVTDWNRSNDEMDSHSMVFLDTRGPLLDISFMSHDITRSGLRRMHEPSVLIMRFVRPHRL